MRIVLLLAATLPIAAGAQTRVERRVPQPAAVPVALGPAAARVVARFDADTADARASFAALRPDAPVASSLSIRVAVEQALRKALPNLATAGLPAAEQQAASKAMWQRILSVDAANTAWLKGVLPDDGWFRISRDGAGVAGDAWLIVQHSPDQALQRDVVSRMAPLVAAGEANGPEYALLYDRVEMFAGRPQRYGSQMTCRGGHWAPTDLEDPAGVDARRASVGLAPMAVYMKNFAGPC